MRNNLRLAFLLIAVLFAGHVQAQKAKTGPDVGVRVGEFKLASKLMARDVPYRVITPKNYGVTEARFPVIYLLHGLTGHYDNWTDKTKLAEFAEKYSFIIVTPEGADGWYTDSAGLPDDKYESYIVRELIPEIDSKFLTRPDRANRFIAGLSMGGYGSLKFGLKYPEKFAAVGSFSGALRAPDWNDKNSAAWVSKSIMSVFGAADSETRKANDIYRMAGEWPADKISNLPFIYLDCGTEDLLIENNHDFAKILREKKIPHEFRELPGKHDWVYWNSQVQEFLRIADRMLPRIQTKAAKSSD